MTTPGALVSANLPRAIFAGLLACSSPCLADTQFVAVSLECPEPAGDVVRLTSRSDDGVKERVSIVVKDGRPTQVTIEASESGSQFVEIFTGDLVSRVWGGDNSLSRSDANDVAEGASERAFKFYRQVCLEEDKVKRARNWEWLKANDLK